MEHTHLGRSGLKVSRLGLGTGEINRIIAFSMAVSSCAPRPEGAQQLHETVLEIQIGDVPHEHRAASFVCAIDSRTARNEPCRRACSFSFVRFR